jgi:hypothetical protein
MSLELACFISPHGYGHATRTIAVLQALQKQVRDLRAHCFTTAPPELFATSGLSLTLHPVITDVGLIQTDAFTVDQPRTVARLAELLPFRESLVSRCAGLCGSCRLILCDISCLGIAVAQHAEIPSLLVENFTWDWIYERLDPPADDLLRFGALLSDYYRQATYRIQTDPLCNPVAGNLRCPPMARMRIQESDRIRERIGCGARTMVLITMGGIRLDLPFIERLSGFDDYLFVIAGQQGQRRPSANVLLLDHDPGLHHPDLIGAADLVICKNGYSTIAECAQTRTPICCVSRHNFAESAVLDRYVSTMMGGVILELDRFLRGDWLDGLDGLMKQNRTPAPVNGADQAASFIMSLLQPETRPPAS